MSHQFDAAKQTDRGKRRSSNEDFCDYYIPDANSPRAELGALFVVADGIGSLPGGTLASRTAVRTVLDHYYDVDPDSDINVPERLREALTAAHTTVRKTAQQHSFSRIGTTLVGFIALPDGSGWTFSVGDSRIYKIGPELEQVTTDDANEAKKGSPLSAFIGQRDPLQITLRPIDIQQRDVFIICSDGLWKVVKPHEINRIAKQRAAKPALRQLIELALKRGAPDNVTAIIVRRGRPPVRRRVLFAAAAGLLIVVLIAGFILLGGPATTADRLSEPERSPTVVGLVEQTPDLIVSSATPQAKPATPTHTPRATITPAPTGTDTPRPTLTDTPMRTPTATNTSEATATVSDRSFATILNPQVDLYSGPGPAYAAVSVLDRNARVGVLGISDDSGWYYVEPSGAEKGWIAAENVRISGPLSIPKVTWPTPTSLPTDTFTPAPTATETPDPTSTLTATATPSPTATVTPSPSATSVPSQTPSPTPTATDTLTMTPSPSVTPTTQPTQTLLPGAATVTPSPTSSPVPTVSATPEAGDPLSPQLAQSKLEMLLENVEYAMDGGVILTEDNVAVTTMLDQELVSYPLPAGTRVRVTSASPRPIPGREDMYYSVELSGTQLPTQDNGEEIRGGFVAVHNLISGVEPVPAYIVVEGGPSTLWTEPLPGADPIGWLDNGRELPVLAIKDVNEVTWIKVHTEETGTAWVSTGTRDVILHNGDALRFRPQHDPGDG